jgi:hypothetical protein
MTQLSPQAQATLDAYDNRYEMVGPLETWQEPCLAAAIRELVEQTLPEEGIPDWEPAYKLHERQQRQRIRAQQLAVAAELERA